MQKPAPKLSLSRFCLRILASGDLETKLRPPPAELSVLREPSIEPPESPARDPEIAACERSARLPRPSALFDPEARSTCLARFAHHELMAVELFAFALLRWPDMPAELRRTLIRILADEQTHCRLYLERLAAHGHRLGDHPQTDYFWRHVAAISHSPAGPRAFLAAMGLTLEQANLDFTLVYRDAFAAAGDSQSAEVCQRVHDDEIRHVQAAAHWLGKLSPQESTDLDAYHDAVPFPLSLARAKARRFDAASRRRAGLSEEFIEAVREARSSQETGRVPVRPQTGT